MFRLRLFSGLGRGQRAASAVEFALVLPLLVTILLGAIDFGRFAFSAITVANAARTGAAVCQHASSCNLTDAQIKTIVRNEALPYLDLDDTLPTVAVTVDKDACGASPPSLSPCVEVRVAYQFQTLIPWPGIPADVWIARSARIPRGIV